jgi:hypothetical protein
VRQNSYNQLNLFVGERFYFLAEDAESADQQFTAAKRPGSPSMYAGSERAS